MCERSSLLSPASVSTMGLWLAITLWQGANLVQAQIGGANDNGQVMSDWRFPTWPASGQAERSLRIRFTLDVSCDENVLVNVWAEVQFDYLL